jgi:hypothetical protein
MHHVAIPETIYWMSCNATSFGFTWPSSGQTSLMQIVVYMNAVFCRVGFGFVVAVGWFCGLQFQHSCLSNAVTF